MSNYNAIYNSMMGNLIENFQQLDPNMMLPSATTDILATPPMSSYEPPMSMDMMKSMVKENFDDGNEVVEHDGTEGDDNAYQSTECSGDNCENFDEGEDLSHDGEDYHDNCPDGEICERFEDEVVEHDGSDEDTTNHYSDECEGEGCEKFENTENKDMELWTCYPNKENFENVNDSLFYKAGGELAEGSSNKSSTHAEDKEMSRLYMYLAIAVVLLMVIYLLTNKN